MSPSWETVTVLAGLLVTMAAYALFAGADFGGGIWDLLAGSTQRGAEPRAEIDASVTPVWEGNQTWIVLGLVLLWTAFPAAFADLMTSLFVPLALSLLGILLRGIGFAFRHEAERVRTQQFNGVLFGAASLLAPFFLGVALGAVATGAIAPRSQGNQPGAWMSPTPLLTGALFVCACAYIGAVYLVGDSHQRSKPHMVSYFSRRALLAGAVTSLLAAANMALLWHSAPYTFHRLIWWPGLPLVIVSVAGGVAALVLILLGRVFLLRVAAGLAVVGVIAAWGVAQYPWLFPTHVSLVQAAAPTSALRSELAVLALAALLVVPAFIYLYRLQQTGRLMVTESSSELREAARAENRGSTPAPASPRRDRIPALAVAVVGLAVLRRALPKRHSR